MTTESAPASSSCWHVRRAADALDHIPLLSTAEGRGRYGELVRELQRVLRSWDRRRHLLGTFLNRKTFLHEVEEVIVPLSALIEHARRRDAAPAPRPALVVFDLCCGKGFFGMLLSYVAGSSREPFCTLRRHVRRVYLLEKRCDVRWEHIDAANADIERRRGGGGAQMAAEEQAAIPLSLWKGCNIHDVALEQRILSCVRGAEAKEDGGDGGDGGGSGDDGAGAGGPGASDKSVAVSRALVLVGIHLCRRLSSRFVELCNLMQAAAPAPGVSLAVLAPCCLPGFNGPVRVRTRFGPIAAAAAAPRARGAEAEAGAAADEEACVEAARAARWAACWRCGETGHAKRDCPYRDAGNGSGGGAASAAGNDVRAGKQQRLRALDDALRSAQLRIPTAAPDAGGGDCAAAVELTAGALAAAPDPFGRWCEFLRSAFVVNTGSTAAQMRRLDVALDDSGARAHGSGAHAHGHTGTRAHSGEVTAPTGTPVDWNSKRKTTWLVLQTAADGDGFD